MHKAGARHSLTLVVTGSRRIRHALGPLPWKRKTPDSECVLCRRLREGRVIFAAVTTLETPAIASSDELICLGHGEDLVAQGGSVMPPIVQTSLFVQETVEDLVQGLGAEHTRHVYSRGQNPTVEAVEAKLAALERGEACKCVASGMAAVSATMFGLLSSGDHVLFVNNVYGPTLRLAGELERFGVLHDVLLDGSREAVEAALTPGTRMLWIESPGTMRFRALDVRALTSLARERGITTVLDNSWATPLFQKPLEMGVDVAIHSATKYIGGHSDVVAGALITDAERYERIYHHAYMLLGGMLAPFDAWLLVRGLRTLPIRMRQHHTDGLAVARYLAGHDRVRQVFHPGLDEAAPPAVATQLSGYSGLFSLELDTDRFDDVCRFVDGLRRFRKGVSWGGVESLVISPNRGGNAEALAAAEIPPGTVRLSVGLEGADVLQADLEQALALL